LALIGDIIAETNIASLQLIVQLLLQTNPVFGQSAMLTGVLAHLLQRILPPVFSFI
jgi:hypothetical protein